MRILLASHSIMPHIGGVQTYFRNLSAQLEGMGHQVDILAWGPRKDQLYISNGPAVERAIILGPVTAAVRRYYQGRQPADPLILRREAERYTLELAAAHLPLDRYDIIHANDVVAARALARVKPAGLPLVATVHGLMSEELLRIGSLATRDSPAFRYVTLEERLGVHSADRLILPSQWVKAWAQRHWDVPEERISVIPYGLNLPDFLGRTAAEPDPLPQRGRKSVIFCPARLAPEKGQSVLVSALQILTRHRRDCMCWFAGAGPSRGPLQRLVARLGLGRAVEFLGNRDDVPALLGQADVVVLPSRLDNLPQAVMEAQVAGRAVIASRVGGIPEIIQDGQTGLLVPPNNPHALARAIRRLLDDAELRRLLGVTAAVRGQSAWDGERMARETLAVYENLRQGEGAA